MNIIFINSQSFWLNGWLSTSHFLKHAMDTLASMGITVSTKEISHAKELESLLSKLPANTLVWPNAYYTRGESGEIVWIQELIEKYNLPFVGTGVQGLKTMLDKTHTHQVLHQAGVPIPQNITISRANFEHFEDLLEKSELNWPIVVKPTSESCSMGVLKANTLAQAKEHIVKLFDEFPQSNALLETFLPSEDTTCAYLQLGDNIMLLPTYYKSLKMPGKEYVVERDLGVAPWGGPDIVTPPVQNKNALQQLANQMPVLVQSMNITGVIRADSRMDAEGTLRFFDVNGMPGLSFPDSVLVRQVRECFPKLSDHKAYEYLLNTIVTMAADRFNLPLPNTLVDQNLFSFDGSYAVRLSTLQEA